MKSFASGSTYTRQRFRTLTTLWVTKSRRPFKIIEDKYFREIVTLLNPTAAQHSAQTVSRDVSLLYQLSREKVIEFLAGTTGVIHIGLDVWTDVQMIPWFGVVPYLVVKWKYKK